MRIDKEETQRLGVKVMRTPKKVEEKKTVKDFSENKKKHNSERIINKDDSGNEDL